MRKSEIKEGMTQREREKERERETERLTLKINKVESILTRRNSLND